MVKRFGFINKSLVVFILLLLTTSTLLTLHFQNIIAIPSEVINIVTFFLSFAIIIVITTIILRATVNGVFEAFKKDLEIEQRILLTKIYSFFIYSIAISVVLYIAGVGLNDITLFIGLITTGIALAIRDIIMSFFIWLVVLTKRPFRIGEAITCGDDTGIVDRIGTFYITLKVKSGQETHLVRVPTKILLDKNLKNHGVNKISGEIKLNLAVIPENIEKWINDVTREIKYEDADTYVSIDTDNKDIQLSVKYMTDYDKEKDVRVRILTLLFKNHKAVFKEAKDGKS
ncbi:mechanosensitive ion channel family protein [Candidatus Woesearchaeota archaeon]|nr:mechanosensitive ion channel family protein [Candidatus Woesearchaeota archaeon]